MVRIGGIVFVSYLLLSSTSAAEEVSSDVFVTDHTEVKADGRILKNQNVEPEAVVEHDVQANPENESKKCSEDVCDALEANSSEESEEDHTPLEVSVENSIGAENSSFVDNTTELVALASKKVHCSNSILESWTENSESPSVKIVNGTQLSSLLSHDPNVTSRATVAPCAIVYFFASWCHHSARAAPQVNALPRAFPGVPVLAVDSIKHHSVNTQHGVMAVPTLMLFHNGRPVSRFNESEYNLNAFANFITRTTGLDPVCLLNVTSKDYIGPLVPEVIAETDYVLLLSWLFLSCAFICAIFKAQFWQATVDRLLLRWREQDLGHEHVE